MNGDRVATASRRELGLDDERGAAADFGVPLGVRTTNRTRGPDPESSRIEGTFLICAHSLAAATVCKDQTWVRHQIGNGSTQLDDSLVPLRVAFLRWCWPYLGIGRCALG